MHFLKGVPEGEHVFITEGAWSAMKIHQVLYAMGVSHPCLALLGAKASATIVDVLRPFTPYFLYDGDKAGIEACRKMRKLWPGVHAWTVAKSPDDMDDEEIYKMLQLMREKVTG
jgi:DNA primase